MLNNIMFFVLIGMSMNLMVMINNDSKMPVFFYFEENMEKFNEKSGESTIYLPFNKLDEVRSPLFADIFGIEGRWVFKYSIGDIFIFGGILMFLLVTIKDLNKMFRRKYGINTSNE